MAAKASLAKTQKENTSMKTRWKRAKDRAKQAEASIVTGLATVGAAGGAAYTRELTPDKMTIMGQDTSAVLSLVLGGVAFAGLAGGANTAVMGASYGLAAEYATEMGREAARRKKDKDARARR